MRRKIAAAACALSLVMSQCAWGALFENKKLSAALQDGAVRVGMDKQELVDAIGYPPSGKPNQDNFFYRFAQTKVTASGKEESWTYQIEPTPEGVRSVTFKLLDGKVQEWNEWLDSGK